MPTPAPPDAGGEGSRPFRDRAKVDRADHSLRPSAFRRARFRRSGVTLNCVALPRRNGTTPRAPLGRCDQRLDDRFLRSSFSIRGVPYVILDWIGFSICSYGNGNRSASGFARISANPVGASIEWNFLYSKSLVRSSHHLRHHRAFRLRLVACYSSGRQHNQPATLVGDRLRDSTFLRHRRWANRILSGLCYRRAPAVDASRRTPLNLITTNC
jgi:hypothetical protein